MPLVPEIARYACVLGRPRGRWDPGNLLLTTIGSGAGPSDSDGLASRLTNALRVEPGREDIFAWYVETSLAAIPHDETVAQPPDIVHRAPAWRRKPSTKRTPAERFVQDLDHLILLKDTLTRRQWTVLVEALLRIGLATHVLWLCRLNACVWELALRATESGEQPSEGHILNTAWAGHDAGDPLLELGRDGNAIIKNRIQSYVQARIGLNLLLHALTDAGCGWSGRLGVAQTGDSTPAGTLSEFLSHVAANRAAIASAVQGPGGLTSLKAAANAIADANPRLMNLVTGFPKNLWEFLRYSLMQIKPKNPELATYDQTYLLHRETRSNNSPRLVRPGPAALILLVHTCCRSAAGAPASLDDFKAHLAEYGLRAPAGELQRGRTARDLEQLGLVVDSPDAGGGRLLVDPF